MIFGVIHLLTETDLIADGNCALHIYKKQYTEKQNDTEYSEGNVYNNKKLYFKKLNKSIQNIETYIQWHKIEKYEW